MDFKQAAGLGLMDFGSRVSGGGGLGLSSLLSFQERQEAKEEEALFASTIKEMRDQKIDPMSQEGLNILIDRKLIPNITSFAKWQEISKKDDKHLAELASYVEKGAEAKTEIGKKGYAAAAGVPVEATEPTPTLRQQAYTRLFPGASRADYKEFEAIYGPLVRQKQDPEMELAGLTDFDPWEEAVAQYAKSLNMPNPLENKGQGQPPMVAEAPPQQEPTIPQGKIAQESAAYAQELQKRVASGALTQDEAAALYDLKYGNKKR